MASISLKALVDKGSNKVIFIDESDDLIDALLSFMTFPLGKLIKLTRQRSLGLNFHCIHNVYRSVENIIDKGPYSSLKHFLDPYYLAAPYLKNLKLEIEDVQSTDNSSLRLFCSRNCNLSRKVFGLFGDIRSFNRTNLTINTIIFPKNASTCGCKGQLQRLDSGKFGGGLFIKEHAGLKITDDLEVMPPLVGASSPLFTKFGVMVGNCNTAEMTFKVGLRESPLTDTLLKKCPVTNLSINDFNQAKWKNAQSDAQNKEGNISVKLMISKSKKMVCYAEAGADFVNLLFSFLMVPFGFIVKRIKDGSLDALIRYAKVSRILMINTGSRGGTRIISFKVPLTDFEEKMVHVGKDEVFRLLVTSFFLCDSVLTNVFLGPPTDEP